MAALGVAAGPEPDERWRGTRFEAQGAIASLEAPSLPARLEGVTLDFSLDLATGVPTGSFGVERVRDLARPARFPQLQVAGTLEPTASGAAGFDARLRDTASRLALRLRGQHDLTAGRGSATLQLAPLDFAPGQPPPRIRARDPGGGGGRLAAVEPGRLSDEGDTLPEGVARESGGLDVLRGALRNFEFRELAIRLDGDPQARMAISVDLAAALPIDLAEASNESHRPPISS